MLLLFVPSFHLSEAIYIYSTFSVSVALTTRIHHHHPRPRPAAGTGPAASGTPLMRPPAVLPSRPCQQQHNVGEIVRQADRAKQKYQGNVNGENVWYLSGKDLQIFDYEV